MQELSRLSPDLLHHSTPPLSQRGGPSRLSSVPSPRPSSSKSSPRTSSDHISVPISCYSNSDPLKSWNTHDPRSSSTQSLLPVLSAKSTEKRTLLLIYIHGFLGNESSFQSFPAHVHQLLSITLDSTHVVHTKIYPRYKSRRAIEFARDDFSTWLGPHVGPTTDVVLIGHSMGGLLAAEVVLLLPRPSIAGRATQRHRILGTVNLDTPFLGIHPGVIVSGIGSLFRSAPSEEAASTSQQQNSNPRTRDESLDSAGDSDPTYNPPFPNDVRTPLRTGWISALHFLAKHSNGLTKASKDYVTSHLEFGGCLTEYSGLRRRYSGIRKLEEQDREQRGGGERVRWVNYYTASTGRAKKSQLKGRSEVGEKKAEKVTSSQDSLVSTSHGVEHASAKGELPLLSTETDKARSIESGHQAAAMQPLPVDNSSVSQLTSPFSAATSSQSSSTATIRNDLEQSLPSKASSQDLYPVPVRPRIPPPLTLPSSVSQDVESQVLLQKSQARQDRLHAQALKNYNASVRERDKLIAKRDKAAQKTEDARLKAARKQEEQDIKNQKKQEAEKAKGERRAAERAIKADLAAATVHNSNHTSRQAEDNTSVSSNPLPSPCDENSLPTSDDVPPPPSKPSSRQPPLTLPTQAPCTASDSTRNTKHATTTTTTTPVKDLKFCMLPSRNPNGVRDRCWVRVPMEDVDEVGAHCGLFSPQGNARYESLVGDVGETVERWVKEDLLADEVYGT